MTNEEAQAAAKAALEKQAADDFDKRLAENALAETECLLLV